MSREEMLSNLSLSRRQLLVAGGMTAFVGLLSACGKDRSGREPATSLAPAADGPTDPLDFSGRPDGPIDPTVWSYDLDPLTPTYNQEAQIYTNSHAHITDDRLIIDAVKTAKGYESSRLTTQGKFSFTYGTLTARAKLPTGVGTWPALWLLPEESDTPKILQKYGLPNDTDDDFYYVWGGEIDWLETVGAQDHPVNNQPAVHTYNSRSNAKPAGASTTVVDVPDGQETFHEYGLHKAPGLLEFTLDGKTVHKVARKRGDSLQDWPFDDYSYYVIANLAMGGSWGGERRDEFPPHGIDDSQAPWAFEIADLHFTPR